MKDVPAGFVRIETPTAHAVLNVEDWRLPQGGRLQARLTHLEVGLKDGVRSLRAMRQCKGPKKEAPHRMRVLGDRTVLVGMTPLQ